MPNIVYPNVPHKWEYKPDVGHEINRDHPLAPGLTVSLAFNEGAGEPWDAAGQRIFPVSHPAVWSATGNYPSRYATGGTSVVEIPQEVISGLMLSPFTIRFVFRFRTLAADYTSLTDSTGRQFSIFLGTNGSGNFAIGSAPGFGLTAGPWWDFIITRTPANTIPAGLGYSYKNGVYRADVTGLAFAAITGDLCFGRNCSGGGANADADYALIQIWQGRALTSNEISDLSLDPFGLYSKPTTHKTFSFTPSVSVTPSTFTGFSGGLISITDVPYYSF